MKKYYLIGFLFFLVYCSNVFGQETKNNSLAIGLNLSAISPNLYNLGGGLNLEYEYRFNKMFSISLDIGTDLTIIPYAEIKGRWFPWSRIFFVGMGIGLWGLLPQYSSTVFYKAISPNIGWQINIGKNNNWFIMPNFTARIMFLNTEYDLSFICKTGIQIGYKF